MFALSYYQSVNVEELHSLRQGGVGFLFGIQIDSIVLLHDW